MKNDKSMRSGNRSGKWFRSAEQSREYPQGSVMTVRTGLRQPGPEFDRDVNSVQGERGTYYDRDHWLKNHFTPSEQRRIKAGQRNARSRASRAA